MGDRGGVYEGLGRDLRIFLNLTLKSVHLGAVWQADDCPVVFCSKKSAAILVIALCKLKELN